VDLLTREPTPRLGAFVVAFVVLAAAEALFPRRRRAVSLGGPKA